MKLGDTTLTFHFPTAATAPEIKVQGQCVTVGTQRIENDAEGNFQFGAEGEKETGCIPESSSVRQSWR